MEISNKKIKFFQTHENILQHMVFYNSYIYQLVVCCSGV